jgi:hypothetical protein
MDMCGNQVRRNEVNNQYVVNIPYGSTFMNIQSSEQIDADSCPYPLQRTLTLEAFSDYIVLNNIVPTNDVSLHEHFTLGEDKYELTAIINYIGNVESGHYTSYVRGENGWFFFDNDKYVIESEDPTNVPYVENVSMIMYRKVK